MNQHADQITGHFVKGLLSGQTDTHAADRSLNLSHGINRHLYRAARTSYQTNGMAKFSAFPVAFYINPQPGGHEPVIDIFCMELAPAWRRGITG